MAAAESQQSWFGKMFGFEETLPSIKKFLTVVDRADGKQVLKSSAKPEEEFAVGDFQTPALKTLRMEGAALPRTGALKLSHVAATDVFTEHHRPDNRDAMFQAASQFNCLEFASPSAVPENGVTGYMYDNTQGPACALAAAPGTVFRNYFCKMPDGTEGQTKHNQLNNLDGVLKALGPEAAALIRVNNGYVDSSADDLIKTNELIDKVIAASPEGREALVGELKIGVHSEVEVPFAERYSVLPRAERSKVSQAYCSALSIAYSRGGLDVWAPLATIVLDGTYEATLWAAAIEKAKGTGSGVVYLTFIGGGVFGNSQEWIDEAIAKACVKLSDIDLDVRVCHYRRVDPAVQADIDQRFAKQMKEKEKAKV